MNNNQFETALVKAASANGIDVEKLRADEKMMLLCIDLYYIGASDGIQRLGATMKEKQNVALPSVPVASVS